MAPLKHRHTHTHTHTSCVTIRRTFGTFAVVAHGTCGCFAHEPSLTKQRQERVVLIIDLGAVVLTSKVHMCVCCRCLASNSMVYCNLASNTKQQRPRRRRSFAHSLAGAYACFLPSEPCTPCPGLPRRPHSNNLNHNHDHANNARQSSIYSTFPSCSMTNARWSVASRSSPSSAFDTTAELVSASSSSSGRVSMT